MTDINETLAQRQQTHGNFESHAIISQHIKGVFYKFNYQNLNPIQVEALDMIAHKIARILNGNPHHHDHWHDISGYATLVANDLK